MITEIEDSEKKLIENDMLVRKLEEVIREVNRLEDELHEHQIIGYHNG